MFAPNFSSASDGSSLQTCEVCRRLDHDSSLKPCKFCSICKAWICDYCRGNVIRRARAMLNG